MIIKKRNKCKTLFKDLSHFIKQGNKLVEGLRAILRQGLALFHLLKQAFLANKENSRFSLFTSIPPPIQPFISTLSNIRSLLATKLYILIFSTKPVSIPILLPPKLLSLFGSLLPSSSISISNSTFTSTTNSNSSSISLSFSALTFSFAIFSLYLHRINCFSPPSFVGYILFYLFYIFLTFF